MRQLTKFKKTLPQIYQTLPHLKPREEALFFMPVSFSKILGKLTSLI